MMVAEERETVVEDLSFSISASNSLELIEVSLEGRLIDLMWICEIAIFRWRERERRR